MLKAVVSVIDQAFNISTLFDCKKRHLAVTGDV